MKKFVTSFLVLLFVGCGSSSVDKSRELLNASTGSFKLSSINFIPAHGSPELSWANEPDTTESFAIVIDDIDADDYLHWAVFNIDRSIHHIDAQNRPLGSIIGSSENRPSTNQQNSVNDSETLDDNNTQDNSRNEGENSTQSVANENGYEDPQQREEHRYVAHIYALSISDLTHIEGKDINNLLAKAYNHKEFEQDFGEYIVGEAILVSNPKEIAKRK